MPSEPLGTPPVSSGTDPNAHARCARTVGCDDGTLLAHRFRRVAGDALLGGHHQECLAAQSHQLSMPRRMPLPCDAVPPLVRRVGGASPHARNRAERIQIARIVQVVRQSPTIRTPRPIGAVVRASQRLREGCSDESRRWAPNGAADAPLSRGFASAAPIRLGAGHTPSNEKRLRRNSRARSGEWSGGKSRARSRTESRAWSVTEPSRVVDRVPSRVLTPVSLPVTDRAAPPLAPQSR